MAEAHTTPPPAPGDLVDDDDLSSLAAKLDRLELTAGERQVLLAVFDAVVDPSGWVGIDVHGFGFDPVAPHAAPDPEPVSVAFLKLFGR